MNIKFFRKIVYLYKTFSFNGNVLEKQVFELTKHLSVWMAVEMVKLNTREIFRSGYSAIRLFLCYRSIFDHPTLFFPYKSKQLSDWIWLGSSAYLLVAAWLELFWTSTSKFLSGHLNLNMNFKLCTADCLDGIDRKQWQVVTTIHFLTFKINFVPFFSLLQDILLNPHNFQKIDLGWHFSFNISIWLKSK